MGSKWMVIRKYSVITYCDKVKKVHYEESLKSIYLSIYTNFFKLCMIWVFVKLLQLIILATIIP